MSDSVPVKIEPWKSGDQDAVIQFIVGIQQGEFRLPITGDDQPDLSAVESFYRANGGEFWVASDDGRVVGTIALVGFEPGHAAIRKMFVAPSHRGKVGLATTLMTVLIEWAGEHALHDIWLGTTSVMTTAQRFYTRHGFSQVDRSDLPAAFPMMAVDSVFFHRAT
jgi:N-acetylglutamate synthase-like GNAT family acetyltransferase